MKILGIIGGVVLCAVSILFVLIGVLEFVGGVCIIIGNLNFPRNPFKKFLNLFLPLYSIEENKQYKYEIFSAGFLYALGGATSALLALFICIPGALSLFY